MVRSLTPRQVLVRSSDGSRGNVTVAGAGATAPVGLRFSLHPGWNTVRFETEGPAAPSGGERGTLAGSPSWWRSCSSARTVVARRRDRGRIVLLMLPSCKRLGALVVSLLLGAAASQAAAAQTGPSAPVPLTNEVRAGRLPNGLTYFIRRNARPQGRAELRLVVDAGSILEDDDQLGAAHFIEHMSFNGTAGSRRTSSSRTCSRSACGSAATSTRTPATTRRFTSCRFRWAIGRCSRRGSRFCASGRATRCSPTRTSTPSAAW